MYALDISDQEETIGNEAGQPASGYSNSNSVATTDDHRWLTWMSGQLGELLSKLGRPLQQQQQQDLNDLDGLTLLANQLTRAFRKLQRQASGGRVTGQQELFELWRQKRLVLYTCGASNTGATNDDNKSLLLPAAVVDNEHRDKLARVRPVFSSILVQTNGELFNK